MFLRFIFFFTVFFIFEKSAVSGITDNILPPFERFLYDLETFLPVIKQEVEFAELSGLTDDQAYEQIKTFFPTLQLRIQELRNIGVIAETNRQKTKEALSQMCVQGHTFGYLLVDRQLRGIQEVVVSRKITVANNRKMLSQMEKLLVDWVRSSKQPCLGNHRG